MKKRSSFIKLLKEITYHQDTLIYQQEVTRMKGIEINSRLWIKQRRNGLSKTDGFQL